MRRAQFLLAALSVAVGVAPRWASFIR